MSINQQQAGTRLVVEYSQRFGGICQCGRRHVKVDRTYPWEGPYRERYHRCPACSAKFYSLERDTADVTAKILAEAMN